MDFKDNLRLAREQMGLTQQQVADFMGITKSTYCGYETGKRQPDVYKIKALSQILKVGADRLLDTGHEKAPLLSSEAHNVAQAYDKLDHHGKRLVQAVISEEQRRISDTEHQEAAKVIPLRRSLQPASAGRGTYLGPEEFETIFVIENELTRRASFSLPVSGDSMEPTFHDGDILLVDGSPEIAVGEIGVFTLEGEGYVKQRGDGILISINPGYSPIQMDDGIRCNGRVIGVLKPEWIQM